MAAIDVTIKRVTAEGFGFIATAEGTEYFFVAFIVGRRPKGPRAENVSVG